MASTAVLEVVEVTKIVACVGSPCLYAEGTQLTRAWPYVALYWTWLAIDEH